MSVKKKSSRGEDPLEYRLSEHQIRGWRAVLLLDCVDKACFKGVLFTDTGMATRTHGSFPIGLISNWARF